MASAEFAIANDLFKDEGREEKSEGWYVVPGKVKPIVWTLPVFFVLTIGFLAWFGTLG